MFHFGDFASLVVVCFEDFVADVCSFGDDVGGDVGFEVVGNGSASDSV